MPEANPRAALAHLGRERNSLEFSDRFRSQRSRRTPHKRLKARANRIENRSEAKAMPSPNGKCATPAEGAKKRRKPDRAEDDQSPSAKTPKRDPQPSNPRKQGTPRSAQKSRKSKYAADGDVFDTIFTLMDTSRSDKKNKGAAPKSPPRDRQKPTTSGEPSQPKFISLQTRDDLMRHESDNRICYEFLKKEGLMERLLGHKMLKGRIEPYSYLGFVRKEPLHKPLPPEVFTSEFTKSCFPQKGPPGPRTPPGPGPQTPSGSPGHNSSGRSSPVHIANGYDRNAVLSPQKCMTPPPPPPILLEGGEESEKDELLKQVSQMTETPVDKLEEYFGKDLQNAMGKLDKKTLLSKLKGALKEMTDADVGRGLDTSREDIVAMDIASDASDNSATIDDDEQQRYALSPLLLPPPPAPATPPPGPSTPPPPPPHFLQQQYQMPSTPVYQHYQPSTSMYSAPPQALAPQMPPEFVPQQPPLNVYQPPMEANYAQIPPSSVLHQAAPPQMNNFGAPLPLPPQAMPTQHLLPPPPPAPAPYSVRPVMIDTSIPPPNVCQQTQPPVQHPAYPPPPMHLNCPPPAMPTSMDISVPPPQFAMNQPPPPLHQPQVARHPPTMSTPVRFMEPPSHMTPTYLRKPPPPMPCTPSNVTPHPSNGLEFSIPRSNVPSSIRIKQRGNGRNGGGQRFRRPGNEAGVKPAKQFGSEQKTNVDRSVPELNKAAASDQVASLATNPTEGNVMKTLWNALALPKKEENGETDAKNNVEGIASKIEPKMEREGASEGLNNTQRRINDKTHEVSDAEEEQERSDSPLGFFDEEPCSSSVEPEPQEDERPPTPTMPRPRPLCSLPRQRAAFPDVPSFFGNRGTPPPMRNRAPLNALRPPMPPFQRPGVPFYGCPPMRGMPRGPFRPGPPPPPWRGPPPNHQGRFF
ncbi:hypothetical protein QR680_009031 [Steinernema hermaphroditum]|uniref:Uncharacterized protein n=1 Tax=Steinernema hermaphroditum TaxID=289476 RepID=A0AA39IK51_9BILA|nr:hypothetical protein QR680_009031 [Steinernema hermaphroditum]